MWGGVCGACVCSCPVVCRVGRRGEGRGQREGEGGAGQAGVDRHSGMMDGRAGLLHVGGIGGWGACGRFQISNARAGPHARTAAPPRRARPSLLRAHTHTAAHERTHTVCRAAACTRRTRPKVVLQYAFNSWELTNDEGGGTFVVDLAPADMPRTGECEFWSARFKVRTLCARGVAQPDPIGS